MPFFYFYAVNKYKTGATNTINSLQGMAPTLLVGQTK
jgi:hypothetical protein